MPYDIAKDFDGCAYAVVKMTPEGKELAPGGCHPTAIEAGKHLAALEAATDYEDRAAGEWVIVDIDGTLTMSDGSDEPRESLVSWMKANDYSYAIVSARPNSRLDETRAWLESNDIPHSSVSLSDFPQGPNAGVAFKKSKAEQLVKNHKIVFAIDNDPAARSAYESAGVKAVGPTTVRYFQLGLELRHPGHGDQSVHNPHKGGAAYAPGGWRPVSPDERTAMDKAVIDNLTAFDKVHGNDLEASKKTRMYLEERQMGDTYVNGNVVVRFPDGKMTKEQQAKVLEDVDLGMSHAPAAMLADKDFPIEINVGSNKPGTNGIWTGADDGKGGGFIGLSTQHMKDRNPIVSWESKPTNRGNSDSIYPESTGFHPQVAEMTDSASFTVYHEIGHAVGYYSGTKSSNFGGDKGVFTNTSRGMAGYISTYAKKNVDERYAEHFAAFVLGATDKTTTEIAALDKWRKP